MIFSRRKKESSISIEYTCTACDALRDKYKALELQLRTNRIYQSSRRDVELLEDKIKKLENLLNESYTERAKAILAYDAKCEELQRKFKEELSHMETFYRSSVERFIR